MLVRNLVLNDTKSIGYRASRQAQGVLDDSVSMLGGPNIVGGHATFECVPYESTVFPDTELQTRAPTDVLLVVIENSDFVMLLTWRATCSTFHAAVAVQLRVRYEMCLRPFVRDMLSFDSILRLHGGVVSGSVALKFFLRSEPWEPRDLDIYVPDHMYNDFVAAIQSRLDFARLLSDQTSSRPSGQRGVASVKEIMRFRTPSGRSVDVIRSTDSCPLTPLRGFWCTLVKNFITPDGAGCGYPRDTFYRKGRVKDSPLSDRDLIAVSKYKHRGFHLIRETRPEVARREAEGAFGEQDSIVVAFRHANMPSGDFLPVIRSMDGWSTTPHASKPVCLHHRLVQPCLITFVLDMVNEY